LTSRFIYLGFYGNRHRYLNILTDSSFGIKRAVLLVPDLGFTLCLNKTNYS